MDKEKYRYTIGINQLEDILKKYFGLKKSPIITKIEHNNYKGHLSFGDRFAIKINPFFYGNKKIPKKLRKYSDD